ncbi:lysozyme inhibitor LprI family protein [Stenotrophomonas maltophilia group sp. CASM26]|uniref:lysozyme inhibitor LprI family protein n=1 Tax=Stenotrophomonas maltophilia group sp. CASM26 TaxID=3111514 RepID=UPI003BF89D58
MQALSAPARIDRSAFEIRRGIALVMCLLLGACQAPSADSATVAAAASGDEPTPAATSTPASATPATTAADADADADDFPAPLPDASYTQANLRPAYTRCVDASEAVTARLQACGDEELSYQEDRLAEIVAGVVASPDSKAKDDWMDAQAAWWSDTNRHCRWDPKTDGQGQRLDAQSCRINRVANRVDQLQAAARSK